MRFFFYGTLILGSGNPVAAVLRDTVRCIGPATTRGRLYAVADWRGPYPALLPGSGTVHGMVCETLPHFGRGDLARMDAYEEYDPRGLATSLYHRRKVPIRMADGQTIGADAYIYNRALPRRARMIAGGDFRAWLGCSSAAGFDPRRVSGAPSRPVFAI